MALGTSSDTASWAMPSTPTSPNTKRKLKRNPVMNTGSTFSARCPWRSWGTPGDAGLQRAPPAGDPRQKRHPPPSSHQAASHEDDHPVTDPDTRPDSERLWPTQVGHRWRPSRPGSLPGPVSELGSPLSEPGLTAILTWKSPAIASAGRRLRRSGHGKANGGFLNTTNKVLGRNSHPLNGPGSGVVG